MSSDARVNVGFLNVVFIVGLLPLLFLIISALYRLKVKPPDEAPRRRIRVIYRSEAVTRLTGALLLVAVAIGVLLTLNRCFDASGQAICSENTITDAQHGALVVVMVSVVLLLISGGFTLVRTLYEFRRLRSRYARYYETYGRNP